MKPDDLKELLQTVANKAVKEFAEKINTKAQSLKGDGWDEYNEGFDCGVREVLYLIDELVKEYEKCPI